jgi:translation initiation factor IF-1
MPKNSKGGKRFKKMKNNNTQNTVPIMIYAGDEEGVI